MRWDGSAGHYEVWYLTLTDPAGGVGVWIRLTMVAPLAGEADVLAVVLGDGPGDRRADRPQGDVSRSAS